MRSVVFNPMSTEGNELKANTGYEDRVIRIAAGILILSALFQLEGNARGFGRIGIVSLATSLIRWCRACRDLGLMDNGGRMKIELTTALNAHTFFGFPCRH